MSTEISVRRAQPGDEDALALVGQATFLETFSGILDGKAIIEHCRHAHAIAMYRQWLTTPDMAIWLAEVEPGAAPVGYLAAAWSTLPKTDAATDMEIKRIYLLDRFQGMGVGKRLLAQAQQHARQSGAARLVLGVYANNLPAIGFYSQQGFNRLTMRQFNVGGRDYDDQVMCLDLNVRR